MIESAAILIATLLLGYYLGTKRSPKEDAQQFYKGGYDLVMSKKPFFPDEIPVGPVKRPTASQLEQLKKPPEVKARDQALEDTLDQVPELVEAKKKVDAAKAAGSWIP